MDPNQQSDQKNQDLMIAPEDSLIPTGETTETPQVEEAQTEGVTYTPPKAWGGDQTSAPVGTPRADLQETVPETTPIESEIPLGQPEVLEASPETPPTPLSSIQVPTTPFSDEPVPPARMETPMMGLPPVTPPAQPNSILRAFLVSLALLLLGIFVGILASRLVPLTSAPTPEITITPTPEITEEASPTATPVVTPTATPSALMELNWKMMTVNSPISIFKSYRIFYPDTWSIKTYKNTKGANDTGSSLLTLVKGDISLNISQGAGDATACLFPGDQDLDGTFNRYGQFRELVKSDMILWRWAPLLEDTPVTGYRVCENLSSGQFVGVTTVGYVTFTGNGISSEILDEINYILEKLVVLE